MQTNRDTKCVVLPIKVISEANRSDHWAVRAKRVKAQRQAAHWGMKQIKRPNLPVEIRLVRVSPRFLDEHDNLPRSLKAVVDGIADWLGVDDADPRVAWRYGQTRPVKGERVVQVYVKELDGG